MRLQAAADRAACKHSGDSCSRDKAGLSADPAEDSTASRPEMRACGEEQVDGRPSLVTCFRVGAVVQAGGETNGIRRRDWPVVSRRAEPPLVRCDGSQASGISRLNVSKVIAAAGTAVGRTRRS